MRTRKASDPLALAQARTLGVAPGEDAPLCLGMAYQNYIDPARDGWQHAYYEGHLQRLEATRVRIDPHHYFDFPQAIGR